MNDNVQLTHTPLGALTVVKVGAFQLSKRYQTMAAAADDAKELGLISSFQKSLLEERMMAVPLGLSTYAEGINFKELQESGFTLG